MVKKTDTKIADDIGQEDSLSLQRMIKKQAYYAGIKRLRRRLSPSQRVFSYYAQSSLIDNISNFLGSTIARPYPLLSGSIFSLIGTLITVYLAKHNGYNYNYFLFVYFFIVGYVIELIIELIINLLSKSD